MPLYSFQCDACKATFEKVRKIVDRKKPLDSPCPECGKEGSVFRTYETYGIVDPGILKADKNMERSGVLKELNRLKEHHPYMRWSG